MEKKITYLQWHVGQLKRLYGLTSFMAQEETSHTRGRLAVPPLPVDKPVEGNGRPGTIKQAIIDVLRENRRQMIARDIWEVMQKRGVTIKSDRPVEVVASTMRASITRGQNIFTKDTPAFLSVAEGRTLGMASKRILNGAASGALSASPAFTATRSCGSWSVSGTTAARSWIGRCKTSRWNTSR